uniref:Uncharacterized protein n=1 Tax=Setaria viridis TaxID=4556 RepID=A0A4U6SXZ2_SETVI|nr:LOW QUALITY PROTEIN: hypothetical protein SEVIR_9G266700v2 [Setaria viridis]
MSPPQARMEKRRVLIKSPRGHFTTGRIASSFGSPSDGEARPHPRVFPGASRPHLEAPGGATPSASRIQAPPPLRVRIPILACAHPPPPPPCSPVPLTTASRRRPPCRWRPASGVRAAPLFLHLPVVASPVRLVVASPSSPHPHAGSIFAGDLLRDCPHLR